MSLDKSTLEMCQGLGITDAVACGTTFHAVQVACTQACKTTSSTDAEGKKDGRGYLSHSCKFTTPIQNQPITCQHLTAKQNLENPDKEKRDLAATMDAELQGVIAALR